MLGFFRKVAVGFFTFSFFALMILFLAVGITLFNNNEPGWGCLVLFGGWIITILVFSFTGTFLGMAEDIAEIRKKFEGNDSISVQTNNAQRGTNFGIENLINQANNAQQSTNSGSEDILNQAIDSNNSTQPERMFWDCPKCGHTNSISSLYCENCSNRKPQAAENSLKKSEKVNISSEVPPVNPTNKIKNINRFTGMFWDCGKCGHTNSSSSMYCENCGNRKS